jgi:hypothetical protein
MSALGQDRSFDLGPPNVRFGSEADRRPSASAIVGIKTTCNLPSPGAHGLICPVQPANLFS